MTSIYGTDSVGFKNVMADYTKALRLLKNLKSAVQKAQSDYAKGWREAIEQKALEKARVAAETFLLIVQDPVGHFLRNEPKAPCECGLDDVTPGTCPAHRICEHELGHRFTPSEQNASGKAGLCKKCGLAV